jgi:Mu transposase, C-terminal domain/Homeodomain-like domain
VLDEVTREAILRLLLDGRGVRETARAVGVSRNAVRRVRREGRPDVPTLLRLEELTPHRDRIEALVKGCAGNLVRVHEELEGEDVHVGYSTLTAFCRRHVLVGKPKQRSGQYHFEPGEEMQHDTSPHDIVIGGRKRRMQCASVVLCYSREMFVQVYPTYNRFYAKAFLTQALTAFGGAARRCMVDNTSVVVAAGTGKNARIAAEMESFGERFGFHFAAHTLGDANRSARVERPFSYIEHNFYPGRTFADLTDLNAQAVAWCKKASERTIRALQTTPAARFVHERSELVPLPVYVPEVYAQHTRIVDVEGLIHLHTNRYSAPESLLGRRVQVRESLAQVRIFVGPRQVSCHVRLEEGTHTRSVLPEHRHRTSRRKTPEGACPPLVEETRLREAHPLLGTLLDRLRKQHGGRAARSIKRLHRCVQDYPRPPLLEAVQCALDYGLTDLARIERMILARVAGDFFQLPLGPGPEDEDEDEPEKPPSG